MKKGDAKKKHSVKLCRLANGGTARAQLKAPVCHTGGLALARPVGDDQTAKGTGLYFCQAWQKT